MTVLYLEGVGVLAPGLLGWPASIPVLQGARAYHNAPLPALAAELLPANERRRATPTIRLALQVAQEALAQAGLEARQVGSVFASSGGDSTIIDRICTVLTQPDRPVSPTHFHNSVHNTPSGYWAIATGCRLPSISLSAYDSSFGAGLLEAVGLAQVEKVPVLLVAYDYPAPFPLSEPRPLTAPFAAALVLSPVSDRRRLAALTVRLDAWEPEDRLEDAGLERLRAGNPAARALPLLQALARGATCRVTLPYSPAQRLGIDIGAVS